MSLRLNELLYLCDLPFQPSLLLYHRNHRPPEGNNKNEYKNNNEDFHIKAFLQNRKHKLFCH
jgi:hypothetical protein